MLSREERFTKISKIAIYNIVFSEKGWEIVKISFTKFDKIIKTQLKCTEG